MKRAEGLHEWVVAFSLTLFLHGLVILLAFLPLGNYFFPFIDGGWQRLASQGTNAYDGVRQKAMSQTPSNKEDDQHRAYDEPPDKNIWSGGMPFQFGRSFVQIDSILASSEAVEGDAFRLQPAIDRKPRSLGRSSNVAKLMPPDYSPETIPVKPLKSLEEEIAENAEDYLLTDVFKEAVPLTNTKEQLHAAEKAFLAEVRSDIEDGRLDMPFSEFIIPAEFFHLSRGLFDQKLQPAFSLEEAMDRFYTKLQRVRAGLPDELNGFGLVMILQRYAENKFYPANGSGMLLDGLFHNLNDCEGGTKEVISYLDALYPHLTYGSNRGMLQTTTGEVIGHMQVFIGPDPSTQNVMTNSYGLTIETTAISEDSIQPFKYGDAYPIEDFVVQYYPEIVDGTPLEALLDVYKASGGDDSMWSKIVGTSNHPLKMSYGTGLKLLSSELYDLENIRTRQLANAFQQSSIRECNPNIDPLTVSRNNIFSNFVAIDGKLRKSLIGHYLADMELWDNQIMPQWKKPEFLATYDDLAATLTADDNTKGHAYVQVDNDTALPRASLKSHGLFLKSQRKAQQAKSTQYLGKGEQLCERRALVDDQLLSYLFKVPLGPGLYFLPEPGEDFPWENFSQDILNDCLAVPLSEGERKIFTMLDEQLTAERGSFRLELYDRALTRGVVSSSIDSPDPGGQKLSLQKSAMMSLFTGSIPPPLNTLALKGMFEKRHSLPSSAEDPSVLETVSELGYTGISSSLLWDALDFWGPDALMAWILEYAARGDLELTTTRANVLLQNVVSLIIHRDLEPEAIKGFINNLLQSTTSEALRLASAITLAYYQGKSEEEISTQIVAYLSAQTWYDAELVADLLTFGLLQKDAKRFYKQRIRDLAPSLPVIWGKNNQDQGLQVFTQFVELLRSVHLFRDDDGYLLLHEVISNSLLLDLESNEASKRIDGDYGAMISKLYLLALLSKTEQAVFPDQDDGNLLKQSLFDSFLAFGEKQPVAKPLASLFLRGYSASSRPELLKLTIGSQFELLGNLKSFADGSYTKIGAQGRAAKEVREESEELYREVAQLMGRVILVYRMLSALTPEQSLELAQFYGVLDVEDTEELGLWYLQSIHEKTAPVIDKLHVERQPPASKKNKVANESPMKISFYNDANVREAMTLLAYSRAAVQGSESNKRVKFRKSKDLRELQDLSKIKVIKGSRKITRQDMSQLTLGLNGQNTPSSIADYWRDTLEVLQGHIEVQQDLPVLGSYLFAPHYPYLTKNNKGFYFPPETIADLHNASKWGGKNDILLSSYLHFKNLPDHLPTWLLETALTRSEFERRIIQKFEQQTFLPMILECEGDKTEFPDGLFDAKWSIRKPFGEDIFPGTLLLLRTGYMEIDPEGEIQFTEKGLRAQG